MKQLPLLLLILSGVFLQAQNSEVIVLHEDLKIIPLTENTFIHVSYTTIEPWGRFGSNGLIYVQGNECFVFDTPVTEVTSELMLQWMEEDQGWQVSGVVVNHFHEDCTAGLALFHGHGIPSYGQRQTARLCEADGKVAPQATFGRRQSLPFGDGLIINYHPGAGHSSDNIVSYLPEEGVLFGGCMIKSLQSGKGNLGDASVKRWPRSVRRVQRQFPELEWVVPGHGRAGDGALLDYTIELFSEE